MDVIDRLIGRAVSLENRQPQRWFLAVWRGDTTVNATWLPEAGWLKTAEHSRYYLLLSQQFDICTSRA